MFMVILFRHILHCQVISNSSRRRSFLDKHGITFLWRLVTEGGQTIGLDLVLRDWSRSRATGLVSVSKLFSSGSKGASLCFPGCGCGYGCIGETVDPVTDAVATGDAQGRPLSLSIGLEICPLFGIGLSLGLKFWLTLVYNTDRQVLRIVHFLYIIADDGETLCLERSLGLVILVSVWIDSSSSLSHETVLGLFFFFSSQCFSSGSPSQILPTSWSWSQSWILANSGLWSQSRLGLEKVGLADLWTIKQA